MDTPVSPFRIAGRIVRSAWLTSTMKNHWL
jgi:hypothetical protein